MAFKLPVNPQAELKKLRQVLALTSVLLCSTAPARAVPITDTLRIVDGSAKEDGGTFFEFGTYTYGFSWCQACSVVDEDTGELFSLPTHGIWELLRILPGEGFTGTYNQGFYHPNGTLAPNHPFIMIQPVVVNGYYSVYPEETFYRIVAQGTVTMTMESTNGAVAGSSAWMQVGQSHFEFKDPIHMPEPSSVLLMLTGLACLRKRRT